MMLPEDAAYIMVKQAGGLPWQYQLAKLLAHGRRGLGAAVAFKDLLSTPWGQTPILPGREVKPEEMRSEFEI